MMTFEEFARKVEYLPLEQQKECYKWYIEGCKSGFHTRHVADEVYAKHGKKPSDYSLVIYFNEANENLKEIENAKAEEN